MKLDYSLYQIFTWNISVEYFCRIFVTALPAYEHNNWTSYHDGLAGVPHI